MSGIRLGMKALLIRAATAALLCLPGMGQDAYREFISDQAFLAPATFLLDASASLGLPVEDVYASMLERNAFPLAACDGHWLPFGSDGVSDRVFFFPDGSWARIQRSSPVWTFGRWIGAEIPGGDEEDSIRLQGTDFSANFVFRRNAPSDPMFSTFECGRGTEVKGTAALVPVAGLE